MNLRKAFLSGIVSDQESSSQVEVVNSRPAVDTTVYQFCKVFRKKRTPEYGCGQQFSDFLKILISKENISEITISEEKLHYYQCCYALQLERQVGNRYFVTGCNASKIVFLITAALEFFEYTEKHKSGNKLEKELYQKLNNEQELVQLLLDSLMYFHIYADLIMLSKSKQLHKSTLDMNQHYLELKCFLAEAGRFPEIVLDQAHKVFNSEMTLYSNNKATNHRLAKPHVWKEVFTSAKQHDSLLQPRIISGCSSMYRKLCAYAVNQLPGGEYWDPEDSNVRKILSELDPSNDLSESLLGLNDYLTTAIPNLDQLARSTLVEVKKNKTVQWLDNLSEERKDQVINLAMASRKVVQMDNIQDKQARDESRRRKMIQEHDKRKMREKRNAEMKHKLSELHLIATTDELDEVLKEINDNTEMSQSKKDSKKLSVQY